MFIFIFIIAILFIGLILLYKKYLENIKKLEEYSAIVDIDKEILEKEKISNKLNSKIEQLNSDLSIAQEKLNSILNEQSKIKSEIKENKNELSKLQKDIYAEKELVEDYGFESFKFEYTDSEKYKEAIKSEKTYQKDLIKKDKACDQLFDLQFNNSRKEGQKVQNQAKKMLIRSFNNEVDDIIKKLTFRNVDTSIDKIYKTVDSLNKLNDKSSGIKISKSYINSKIKELKLVYGKKVKEQEEKEILEEEKEILREQKAAEQEIKRELKRQEDARKKKEQEIKLREEIIKQVTENLGVDSDASNKAKLEIEKLKQELQEILGKEQAISQAQITSAGYVYIISNVGSFGENVFKIGLTRRLEPEQRIRELSSASVPFEYNCHGMIWSLDAVNLESELHKYFDKKRVNKVNKRKEFFKVSFDDIKKVVYEIEPNIELIEDVEAEEYYQSLAIEKRLLETNIS